MVSHGRLVKKGLKPLISLKKIIAFSLPLGLVTLAMMSGPGQSVRAVESPSESPAQLRLSALETLMKGDKHAALDLYEEAIRLAGREYGPESTFLGDLYYEAGRLYLELDQFNQAEDYLRQAVKINPKNASARLALARLLDLREKVQESIGQIREALLINPNSPVARQKFVQTLSKYGQSPSDKAIATQESLTLAAMQKNARDTLKKALADPRDKPESAAEKSTNRELKKAGTIGSNRPLSVPVLPKNLAPLKEEQGKSCDKDGARAALTSTGQTKTDTKSNTKEKEKQINTAASLDKSGEKVSGSKNTATTAPASGSKLPSLFPLKDLSERKLQEELNKRIEARARKKIEEAIKKGSSGDVIDQLKAQARQHEKARAAKTTKAKPVEKMPQKQKSEEKPKQEEAAPAKPQSAAPQMQAAPYFPPVYPMPSFSAPKPKSGKGFVPPPPPTLPMYGGGMMPVMPQVIPPQAAKPAPVKAKVEKPKAAPKEEVKPAEDKPPPMTTTGETDPDFLLDWGELPKNKVQKKAK